MYYLTMKNNHKNAKRHVIAKAETFEEIVKKYDSYGSFIFDNRYEMQVFTGKWVEVQLSYKHKLKAFIKSNTEIDGYMRVNIPYDKKHLILEKVSCVAGCIRKYDYKAEIKNNMLLLHEHDYNANVNERKHIIYKFLIKE